MSVITHQRRGQHRGLPLRTWLIASSLCSVAFVLTLGLTLSVLGSPVDEITRRDYAIAGFKPPPRWELLPRERPSYPQLLAWASRGQGADRAVITLTGKRLGPGVTLQQFAQEADGLRSRPRLEHLRVQLQQANGWFTGQRVVVDATLTGAGAGQHPQVIRQLMFLNPPFGYVLTLVAPQDQGPARYRDLDDTASSLIPLAVLLPADAGSPSDGGTAATPHPG